MFGVLLAVAFKNVARPGSIQDIYILHPYTSINSLLYNPFTFVLQTVSIFIRSEPHCNSTRVGLLNSSRVKKTITV